MCLRRVHSVHGDPAGASWCPINLKNCKHPHDTAALIQPPPAAKKPVKRVIYRTR
jgi:hypothetical protein